MIDSSPDFDWSIMQNSKFLWEQDFNALILEFSLVIFDGYVQKLSLSEWPNDTFILTGQML